MASGRMYNRKAGLSEKLIAYVREFGPWAAGFHPRLTSHLDVNGNVRADGPWLKSALFPFDEVSIEECEELAAGLIEKGLAVSYRVGPIPFLHVPGFKDEQPGLRADREKPEWPVPPEFRQDSRDFPADFPRDAGGLTDACRTKRKEGNGTEVRTERKISHNAGAREAEPISEPTLEQHLGEFAGVLPDFRARFAPDGEGIERGIMRRFVGPRATQGVVWQDPTGSAVRFESRPRLLAAALDAATTDTKHSGPFNSKWFREILRGAIALEHAGALSGLSDADRKMVDRMEKMADVDLEAFR